LKPREIKPRNLSDHPEAERVASALRFIPVRDEYDGWLHIGMALHEWDQEAGYELWLEWSRDSKHWDEEECEIKWDSFTPGGNGKCITIATVFKFARDAGWKPTEPKVVIGKGGESSDSSNSDSSKDDGPQTGAQIILAYYRERYQPVFKRGNMVRCKDGSEVPASVACWTPDSELIERLTEAVDAPRYASEGGQLGAVKRSGLPRFFNSWCRVAWGDLLKSLPDEDSAPDDELTREEFRQVSARCHVFGSHIKRRDRQERPYSIERRSLIDWCVRFAKPGAWRSIRSKACWCKRIDLGEGETPPPLFVAIGHEVFAQVKADRPLCQMTSKTFGKRAARYGVGTSTKKDRPNKGRAAVVLDAESVAELTATIETGDEIEVGADQISN
jgi:Primase C terminal 2 (PriCT-2)